MPTVITTDYFKGDLSIPQATLVPDIQAAYSAETPTNLQKLTDAIEKYERLLLVNALGPVQYQTFMLNMNQTSGIWYDLINGKNYDGKVFYGIKDIIAYNVYVNFLKNEATQFSVTGIERPLAANSAPVNPTSRLVEYWNVFVSLYQHVNWGCLGYWIKFDKCCLQNESKIASLYQYLSDFPEDYSIDSFQFYRFQNSLGI